MGEELRRAALIIGQMAFLKGEHGLPGPHEQRRRQRVRGRAGRREGDGDLAPEQIGETARDPRGDLVGTIGSRLAGIGSEHGLHHLRGGAGNIIAGEIEIRSVGIARLTSLLASGAGPDASLLLAFATGFRQRTRRMDARHSSCLACEKSTPFTLLAYGASGQEGAGDGDQYQRH